CRSMLAQLELLDLSRLATHQEIAEVVQGISAVATLCDPEPTLPSVDATCQEATAPKAARPLGEACCCSDAGEACVQPPPPPPRVVPVIDRAPAPLPVSPPSNEVIARPPAA